MIFFCFLRRRFILQILGQNPSGQNTRTKPPVNTPLDKTSQRTKPPAGFGWWVLLGVFWRGWGGGVCSFFLAGVFAQGGFECGGGGALSGGGGGGGGSGLSRGVLFKWVFSRILLHKETNLQKNPIELTVTL